MRHSLAVLAVFAAALAPEAAAQVPLPTQVKPAPAKAVPPKQVPPAKDSPGGSKGEPVAGDNAGSEGAVPQKQTAIDVARFAAAAAQWFAEPDVSLVLPKSAGSGKATFRFKNPKGEAVEWRQLTGSCTCSRAVVSVGERAYELRSTNKKLYQIAPGAEQMVESIPLAAGEEGEVELHVDMKNVGGLRVVHLDIHSTDPDAPMMRLNLRCTEERVVSVNPQDVMLGAIEIGERREFTATVTAVARDFAITGAEPFPAGVTATYEKIEKGELAYWMIKGSFGQQQPGNANPVLVFRTNLPQEPTIQVKLHATVRTLIDANPSFFALGRVAAGKGGSSKVTLSRGDGGNLEATSLSIDGLNIDEKFVSVRSAKEGAKVVVELVVAPEAPKGLVRGEVVVGLDHPTARMRRISFNGFVR